MSKAIKRKITNFNDKNYKTLSEFLKIIDDFSIIPDNDLETIEIGIFDRKTIRAIRLNDQLCLTLLQTANYINTKKHTLEVQFYRHKKSLIENIDYFYYSQKVSTLYFPLRGILKLLKWTHSGFADRFYDNIVDYICDEFTPIIKSRYEQFRIFVLKRDNFTCKVCGKPCNEVHHIFSQAFSPHLKHDPDNAVCSCYGCHDAITKDGRKRFEKKKNIFYNGKLKVGGLITKSQ